MRERYFDVAVNTPLFQTFTYRLSTPPENADSLLGRMVRVPLRRQVAEGVILQETTKPDVSFAIKEIHEISAESPTLSPPYLQWLKWISDYYVYPLGQTMGLMFPPLKKGGKSRKQSPLPKVEKKDFATLTPAQEVAVRDILNHKGFGVHLLHGITGSGKTEVYLELLKNKLASGQQALVLVPEISLTPQLLRRFSERFGDDIAVIHSHLTDREKTNQWWSLVDKEKKILIGARSALFCPFENLGIIVIDEEHETSFKQDEKLKYHARDCAIMLAKILGIPVVLGSATPSLESWNNALEGKYKLHTLPDRISAGKVPDIAIVDMRKEEEPRNHDLPAWLSEKLYLKIKERLKSREQTALFLNRRGLSQTILCRECGCTYKCPNCDVSLSLHASTHLVCHYCGYHEDLTKICKECHIGEPKPLGVGTEKVEVEMKNLFPEARLIRLDRDEITTREHLEDAIAKIEMGAVDILIGTQMIAKGLDFPKLTLVGILLADIGFSIPDFRSAEKSFQLLTQVSGRPGRHTQNGEVIIQTFNPEYSPLLFAKTSDYIGFAKEELLARKDLYYPPFGKLASIRICSNNSENLKNYCARVLLFAEKLQERTPQIQVLGPAPAPIYRLKNKFRYHMLLKSSQQSMARYFYQTLCSKLSPPKGVQISLDVDPQSTF